MYWNTDTVIWLMYNNSQPVIVISHAYSSFTLNCTEHAQRLMGVLSLSPKRAFVTNATCAGTRLYR